jgi:hypothetical protein
MFLISYKEKFNLNLFITPWEGSKIFKKTSGVELIPVLPPLNLYDGITNFVLNQKLISLLKNDHQYPVQNAQIKTLAIEGTSSFKSFQSKLQAAFELKPEIQIVFQEKKNQLVGARPLIVAHFRQGDYYEAQKRMQHVYVMPMSAYHDELSDFVSNMPDSFVYFASEKVQPILPLFEFFHPVTFENFDLKGVFQDLQTDLPLFFDYYMMTQADHLLISNSTLSFSAAMMNSKASTLKRPHFLTQTFRSFDPWSENALEKKPFFDSFLVENFEDDQAKLEKNKIFE